GGCLALLGGLLQGHGGSLPCRALNEHPSKVFRVQHAISRLLALQAPVGVYLVSVLSGVIGIVCHCAMRALKTRWV
ncbi:hypothetical protein, partial [Myxococcus xanthus]|uniref:hypothetical protein n=1 Tax=Myxococcus xanthus TaxID=34 RepID=UPI001C110DE4